MRYNFVRGDLEWKVEVERDGDGFRATLGGETWHVHGRDLGAGRAFFTVNGQPLHLQLAAVGPDRYLASGAQRLQVALASGQVRRKKEEAAGSLTSPMPGQVLKVLVEVGATVEVGQTLMIIEAMKMEYEIRAPRAGLVTAIHFTPGQMVTSGASLVEVGH